MVKWGQTPFFSFIDSCVNNVLLSWSEGCDETDREPRRVGTSALARTRVARGGIAALGGRGARGRGSAQRAALEGGGTQERESRRTRPSRSGATLQAQPWAQAPSGDV